MSRLKLRLQPFFPELKESEEWIRNELISLVRLDGWHPMEWTQEKKNKMITWLERQGEQKPIETTWKPSDEQMNAFEQAYNWYNTHSAQSLGLNSLYYDLKKLKA